MNKETANKKLDSVDQDASTHRIMKIRKGADGKFGFVVDGNVFLRIISESDIATIDGVKVEELASKKSSDLLNKTKDELTLRYNPEQIKEALINCE